MSRDFDPTPGQWYEDLEREETFKVVALDPDDAIVRLQWLNGEIEELDLDAWNELDLELATEPEGWVGRRRGQKTTTRTTTRTETKTTRTTTGTTTRTRTTTTRTTSIATANESTRAALDSPRRRPKHGRDVPPETVE